MQGESGTTSGSTSGIGEKLSHVAEQAREQGSNLASEATERVRGLVGQQIASGADLVGEVARAAQSLAGQPALRTRNQQMTPTNKRGLSRPRFEDSQQHLVYGIKTKKAALMRRL